jgi:hypothetical protein
LKVVQEFISLRSERALRSLYRDLRGSWPKLKGSIKRQAISAYHRLVTSEGYKVRQEKLDLAIHSKVKIGFDFNTKTAIIS